MVNFGLHAVERKAWAEAENWFRQHLAFDSSDKSAHVGLAMSISAQGELRGSVEALRAARHALPHDVDIASQLGTALTTMGRFSEGPGRAIALRCGWRPTARPPTPWL